MNKIIHLLIATFLFQVSILAQIPGFTQFNNNNGLPSNTIYDINQDENGLIWIATDYGVSRFDGLTFKNFTIADGLPDNEILYLFKDSKFRIWLIGFNGKLGYLQNNKFYNSKNTKFLKNLNFNNWVYDILEDSNQNLWFLQAVNNIKKLDSLNNITSYKDLQLPFKNNSNKTQIAEDINGEVQILASTSTAKNINEIKSSSIISPKWVTIDLNKYDINTINKLRKKKAEAFKDANETTKRISDAIFNDFKYNHSSNYLYQTLSFGNSFLITNLNNGALIINPNDKSKNKKILPSVHTTKSYLDREENIWIGSKSNGLFLLPNLHVNGIQFEDEKKNDLHTLILFQNNIVIGNEQSELILLDTKTLKTKASFRINKNSKRLRQLDVNDNSLYILSDFNIHKLNSNLKFEKLKNMYDFDFQKANLKNFKDLTITEGYMYTANANGIAKINIKTNTSEKIWDKRSTAIYHEKKGNLWIGTTSGLYYYNTNSSTIEKFNLGEHFNTSIIYALENSSKGLLVGSNSYGLGILKNGTFKTFSTEDGLLSNYIKSIFIDTKNNIWLSTNFGLNCIELNDNNDIISLKSYTTSDGLYSNDVRASYVHKKNVYVATSKGLNIIDLSKESSSILTPSVHINEILLNNKSTVQTNNQSFDSQSNNIQFNFSGISFKSLGNITFKYRLLGLESDWITTKINSIRYSSLPPNNYTFELKAISKNNLESTPLLFTFIIKPPIHETWWFRSITALLIFAIISLFFYQRNLKNKRKHETKEQISSLRYKALNAQMNPHFINNLLVNINALADKGEIKEVKVSLEKFAELVNLILNSTKSNLINLSEEIEMSKLYLELQKLRFNKNISYSINTTSISQEELDAILVPPMILQPIIENSFKHGFKNANNENTITVNFSIKNDEFLYCEILDNGKGILKNENHKNLKESGISFSNINERLQLINESKSKEKLISISNITDEFNTLVGVKVILKIPLISF